MFQSGVVMWTPNNTFWNRLRMKFGLTIDTTNAQFMHETLRSYASGIKNDVEKEINEKNNDERIKQMFETLRTLNPKTLD